MSTIKIVFLICLLYTLSLKLKLLFQEAYTRGVNARQIPEIAHPNGILKSTFEENRKIIAEHEATSIVHQSILRQMQMEMRHEEEDLSPFLKHKESARLLVTNR